MWGFQHYAEEFYSRIYLGDRNSSINSPSINYDIIIEDHYGRKVKYNNSWITEVLEKGRKIGSYNNYNIYSYFLCIKSNFINILIIISINYS